MSHLWKMALQEEMEDNRRERAVEIKRMRGIKGLAWQPNRTIALCNNNCSRADVIFNITDKKIGLL